MRLRRLDIRRFRVVKPGTVLEFSDGINVILGQNGTGKTTLLELISMIVRSDFSGLRGEAFDFACVLQLSEAVVLESELGFQNEGGQLLLRVPRPVARWVSSRLGPSLVDGRERK